MTNREWLNTLSNMDFVRQISAPCDMCVNAGNCIKHSEEDCVEGQKEWLEQEHESEGEGNA